MNYQPLTKPERGMNPGFSAHMRSLCDVCGKSRNRGNHRACSELRKAAGFNLKPCAPGHVLRTCITCKKQQRNDAMMGNCCAECHAKAIGSVYGMGGDEE